MGWIEHNGFTRNNIPNRGLFGNYIFRNPNSLIRDRAYIYVRTQTRALRLETKLCSAVSLLLCSLFACVYVFSLLRLLKVPLDWIPGSTPHSFKGFPWWLAWKKRQISFAGSWVTSPSIYFLPGAVNKLLRNLLSSSICSINWIFFSFWFSQFSF